MAYGFLTILQWKGEKVGWVVVEHLDMPTNRTAAIARLEARGKAGLYQVVQTQRVVWAEHVGGKLKLRKWHCGSADSLMRGAFAFDRDKGIWPVERASREARAMKRARGRKSK